MLHWKGKASQISVTVDQNRHICLNYLPCVSSDHQQNQKVVFWFCFYYFLFNLSQTSAHAQVQACKQCSLHSCCQFHIIHSDQQLVATQGNSVPVKADKKTATQRTWALTLFDLRCLQKSATRTHKYYINKEHCSEVLFLMAVKAKLGLSEKRANLRTRLMASFVLGIY